MNFDFFKPRLNRTSTVSLFKIIGFLLCLVVISVLSPLSVRADQLPGEKRLQNETILNPPPTGQSIPWSGLGAKATEQAGGKGLSITPTAKGAKLECLLQRLEGEVTPAEFTVTSTAKDASAAQFTMKASAMSRGNGLPQVLAETGRVTVDPGMVRRVRLNVVEEYSVSVDGIRQDFVVLSCPEGQGPLFLQIDLSGATAAASDEGATLTLAGSGRKLAYGKLHVMDAKGRDLPARFRTAGSGASKIGIEVDDANAAYPIRIDPTITDDDWVSMNDLGIPGPNGDVMAIAIHGSDMYIGGGFSVAGRVMAKNIAKWDGSEWSALGSGLGEVGLISVFALAVDGAGNLYAGGDFTTADGVSVNDIAKWDGSKWSALGSGFGVEVIGSGDDPFSFYWVYVSALAVDGEGNLYAGGHFNTAGDVAANNIAKWDGSKWSALGNGTSSTVSALAVDGGGNLYAGGYFNTAGDIAANSIAKWDGDAWSALGSGTSGTVNALAMDGAGNLYAGGHFTTAGGVAANNIAKWDGAAWSALGAGMGEYFDSDYYGVSHLAVDDAGNLYAGGLFDSVDFGDYSEIAKWDGTDWMTLIRGTEPLSVSALAVDGDGNLYAGGNIFKEVPFNLSQPILHVAKWDGTDWIALCAGSFYGSDRINALAADGTDLYIGGDFIVPVGASANRNRIVKWDGTSFSAVGLGIGDRDHWDIVNALAVDGKGNLYAGGRFSTAGGVAANNIAKWDGISWSALGSGMDYDVYSLVVDGNDNLYACGSFTTAGGLAANHIAKWDGTSWIAIRSGTYFDVYALAVDGEGNLYANGEFIIAEGIAANTIAKWEGGTSWKVLGPVMDGTTDSFVSAIAVDGKGNLYAGGWFTIAGGGTHIAKWDGTSWRALGSGWAAIASALAVDGAGNLYACENMAGNIVQWNGTEWSTIGRAMYGGIKALTVDGSNNLYAAGSFIIVGNKVSPLIAKCLIPYEESKKSGGGGGCFIDMLAH